jgi:hypothetical protein
MGLTGTELQPALQGEVSCHLLRGLPKSFLVDPQVLAAYADRYQYDDFIATIRVNGRRIFLQLPNQSELE